MKEFKYSFTYQTAFYSHRFNYSGRTVAENENEAKKNMRLWERFKNIKDLKFEEVVPFSSFSSFENEQPPLDKPLQLVRYGEDKAVTGWVTNKGVYIPSKAVNEPTTNFKLFKVIKVN